MSPLRTLPLVAALLAATSLVGCGYANEGLGRPDIGIGPVAPLRFHLQNPTNSELFVDWSAGHAHFEMSRSGQALRLDRACLPTCGQGCACLACDPEVVMVRRVPPGEALAFEWEAVHFIERVCPDEDPCRCVETWPLTAGEYDVRVTAYQAVLGGEPSPDDPNLLLGAEIQPNSTSCTAAASFSLAPTTDVAGLFDCPP